MVGVVGIRYSYTVRYYLNMSAGPLLKLIKLSSSPSRRAWHAMVQGRPILGMQTINLARKLEKALFNFCLLVLIAALLRVIKFECLVGLVGAHVLPEYFSVVILHRGARLHR